MKQLKANDNAPAIRIHHPNGPWNWGFPVSCPLAMRAGGQVFVSGQMPLDSEGAIVAPGDIGRQTRAVFENMTETLAKADKRLEDLVRLNTYYVYDGPEDGATAYWEEMTRVRLEYLPDPGPAATAVRVKGLPYADCMIQIEGVAIEDSQEVHRERIMPVGSWDWSIPVPLSQGWRVGNRIFVGGQISADAKGHAVAAEDVREQTRNVLSFVERIIEDGGGASADIVHLKVCYRHDGRHAESRNLLDQILTEIDARLAPPGTAVTAFGVNLLYEGLVLEIDAMAMLGGSNRAYFAEQTLPGFPTLSRKAIAGQDEVWLAGQMAVDRNGNIRNAGDPVGQLKLALEGIEQSLARAGTDFGDLAKVNLYYVDEGDAAALRNTFVNLCAVLTESFEDEAPALTAVRVAGLPVEQALVQIDGVAIVERKHI